MEAKMFFPQREELRSKVLNFLRGEGVQDPYFSRDSYLKCRAWFGNEGEYRVLKARLKMTTMESLKQLGRESVEHQLFQQIIDDFYRSTDQQAKAIPPQK